MQDSTPAEESATVAAPSATPYERLTPETILEAVESVGLIPTGGFLALNSYENRVYQIELEAPLGDMVDIAGDVPNTSPFVIAKFYRPNRWSREAILEEHQFTFELQDAEISVVAPIRLGAGQAATSLFEYHGFQFSISPRQGGHPPNLENEDDLEVLARTIARIHALGATQEFQHRQSLTTQRLGHDSRSFLLEKQFIPLDIESAYASTTEHLLQRIEPILAEMPHIRLHGDCHMGNVLWRDETPHFVDFDDCIMGPPIQDLWMLLSGDRRDQTIQLATILDAYNDFYEFSPKTLNYIEALRSLRIMHHAAWIGRRWDDPAFPVAFNWFDSARHWSEHLLSLREQLALLDEPALTYM